jgi:hypothetical protein
MIPVAITSQTKKKKPKKKKQKSLQFKFCVPSQHLDFGNSVLTAQCLSRGFFLLVFNKVQHAKGVLRHVTIHAYQKPASRLDWLLTSGYFFSTFARVSSVMFKPPATLLHETPISKSSKCHDVESVDDVEKPVSVVYDTVPRVQISAITMLCWLYMLHVSITSFIVSNDVDESDVLIFPDCIVLAKMSRLQSVAAVGVLLYMAMAMWVVPLCSRPGTVRTLFDLEAYERVIDRMVTMIAIVTCTALVPITIVVLDHRARVVGVAVPTIANIDHLEPMCDARLLATTSKLSLFVTLLFLIMLVEIFSIVMVVRVGTRRKVDADSEV